MNKLQLEKCKNGKQNYYFFVLIFQSSIVKTEEGKLYLFVAIDRTTKFVYVELLPRCTKTETAQFLRNLIKAIPYKIHTILTDNGIQLQI